MNAAQRVRGLVLAMVAIGAYAASATAQSRGMEPTTRRGPDEGEGPFDRLVIRGAIVIDGTGAPPRGPMDIVVEGNTITAVRSVGAPGAEIDPDRRPAPGTREIDATGMYVLPGFIDVHTHTGGPGKAPQAEYVYKLWLGHGITTVRGVPSGNVEWMLNERALSERNEIVAPRIVACARPGSGAEWDRPIRTGEDARAWVRYAKEKGLDCVKLGAHDPEIMAALLDEADKLSLGTVAHLDQMGMARMTGRRAAELGLDEMTHYYGLFESLLDEYSIQDWPVDYNYNNEYHRFGQVARLWNQIHPPGSDEWNELIDFFLSRDFIISPTLTIYVAGRNVMAARNADWHDEYTLPSLWDFYQPNPESHGSYFFHWTTADEVAWRKFYQVWMQFLDDYNDAGGRLAVGSDAGFIYQLYGFGYIQELELLQEAGLHPLEVIRAATLYGAEAIFEPHEPDGEPIQYGVIRPGLRADLLVLTENPLEDFKPLYGTGALRLNEETGEVERVRALKYTIKDGIIYDSQKLLADVRRMVVEAKRRGVAAGSGTN
ncbi:MAG TPA: amidohydrolase family protein [Longimicrobiales bacterium]